VATVVVIPVVVLATWLSMQAALVMHAQNVVRAAAEDAAVAAASRSGDPRSVASALVASTADDFTSDVTVLVELDPGTVTVVVGAEVDRVVPFGSFSVSESASAPLEVFIAESQRP
jgi:hypothetical protein